MSIKTNNYLLICIMFELINQNTLINTYYSRSSNNVILLVILL